MKKVLGSILFTLLIATPLSFFIGNSIGEASTVPAEAITAPDFTVGVDETPELKAPAPQLTSVRITGITSDGNNMLWENITTNQIKANVPLKGDTLHLKVRFTGYDRGFFAYSDGMNISSSVTKYKSNPLLNSNRVVIGWDYYFSVPMYALYTNSIQIQGINHMLGNIVSSNRLSFDTEEYIR